MGVCENSIKTPKGKNKNIWQLNINQPGTHQNMSFEICPIQSRERQLYAEGTWKDSTTFTQCITPRHITKINFFKNQEYNQNNNDNHTSPFKKNATYGKYYNKIPSNPRV